MISPIQLGAEIVLKIEKMAVGGFALGRHNNAVIFVPFAAPGDTVKIKISEVKKNFYQGEIIEVLDASSSRASPRCPHFGECGGCQWQHLSPQTQLEQKRIILQDLVDKFLPELKITVPNVIASPHFYNYRNRSQPTKDHKIVGFNRRKTHEVIDIKECHLLEKPLAEDWQKLKTEILQHARPVGRSEIYIDQKSQNHWRWIDDIVEDSLFSQVNRFQNETLINHTLGLLKNKPPATILELYAGGGNFTFPIFKEFYKKNKSNGPWFAVEKMPVLVQNAHMAMKEYGLTPSQLQFLAGDVESFLKRSDINHFDSILLDPPRAGLNPKIIDYLINSKANHLIYISCNPVSLARDLQTLTKKFKLASIQAFEMFPQTDHFEVIAELVID